MSIVFLMCVVIALGLCIKSHLYPAWKRWRAQTLLRRLPSPEPGTVWVWDQHALKAMEIQGERLFPLRSMHAKIAFSEISTAWPEAFWSKLSRYLLKPGQCLILVSHPYGAQALVCSMHWWQNTQRLPFAVSRLVEPLHDHRGVFSTWPVPDWARPYL